MKQAFKVHPKSIVEIARGTSLFQAGRILGALGAPPESWEDIYHGHIDIILEEGECSLVDHRETERVLNRLSNRDDDGTSGTSD